MTVDKLMELLNANNFDLVILMLINNKSLKKKFVEHYTFKLLQNVFNRQTIVNFPPIKTLSGRFAHFGANGESDESDVFISYYTHRINYRDKIIRLYYSDSPRNIYDLCNSEQCVKLMHKLDNMFYSIIDHYYKTYLLKPQYYGKQIQK